MSRGRKPLFNTGRAYWRSQGLCIDCGKEIDRAGHYVRCAACRDIRMMQQKLRRDKTEEQTEATTKTIPAEAKESRSPAARQLHAEAVKLQGERARLRALLDRCEVCPFARFVGAGKWFCPLPYCIHEKGF